MIHPTAIIHRQATLHPTVRVGPFAVIDADVEIGADCLVGPHVYLTGHTTIGRANQFHAGCVIGDAPQDLKYKGQPTKLRIGDQNVFREHFTAHRSTHPEQSTTIGSNNFLMANAHVGHNCVVGNQVIIANGALLGGHAVVQDRAFISGNCLVHQFARIGSLAMMRGGAAVSKDLPPFCVAVGENTICGLNTVGLRRAGFAAEERLELKRLYHDVFRAGVNLRTAIADAQEKFMGRAARAMLEFMSAAKRGVCSDRGGGRQDDEDE
jgi:UDP-N-acetylglucosamine acyltransferase